MTPRDRAILTHLWRHPHASIREIERFCLISKAEVHRHLEGLNHLGYISPRRKGSDRTRTLTPRGLLAAQGFEVIYTVGEGGELRFGE